MSALSNLYWKIWKGYEHPGCVSLLRTLQQESRLDAAVWQHAQGIRLQKHLAYVGANVPYYRDLFRQVGFDPAARNWRQQFHRVPVLTKEIVREHQSRLMNPAKNLHMHRNSTGGSTGQPLNFCQDDHYLAASAALDAHVRHSWGIGPIDRTANIWGADIDFSDQGFRQRLYQWRSRVRGLNAFKMTSGELDRFLEMLLKWRPPYLVGYSSALDVLARAALDRNVEGLRFTAIRSSAEKLWPHQRARIEQAFQSPVLDFYGSREVNNLAAECREHGQMHLISTLRYLEITDDHGQPVRPGQHGFVTVTDLTNRAMPFIRYRNDDMAAMSQEPCACGRPAPVIKDLLGRSTDLIRLENGDLIHGEFFTHLFYDLPQVSQFQVRQTAFEKIEVHYVSQQDLGHDDRVSMTARIRKKMTEDTSIEFSRCDAIPPLKSGKHRFTVCLMDNGSETS